MLENIAGMVYNVYYNTVKGADMKGKLLVVFYSKHGYVKRYVDILGNALGCDAVPAAKLKGEMLADYDKILYIGSLKNDEVNGFKKFGEYLDAVYKKTILCGVGLTPYRNYMPRRIKEATVRVDYEKFIPTFYVQGGFNVDELGRFEKFAVAFRVRQIKVASIINDDDTFFMNAVSTPVDEVKKENIQLLIDYLEGKEVDETLYSPPEITDPEEEKQFFEELERAAKAPENKKRSIKKKLRQSFGSSDRDGSESESDKSDEDKKESATATETPDKPAEEKNESDESAPDAEEQSEADTAKSE